MHSVNPNKDSAIRHIMLLFSVALLAAVPLSALYTGEWSAIIPAFHRILFSPSQLVTDYFRLGSLSAAFLNAGLCGSFCTLLVWLLNAEEDDNPGSLAGFFLVIAHCFYGLSFLAMWFPMLGFLLYCKCMKVPFRDNLDLAMFSTAFGPFINELLFRYPFSNRMLISLGEHTISGTGIAASLLLSLFLGFTIPAIIPGAKLLHKGFNLYNGGLAFGLLGMLVYAFLFRTMGKNTPAAEAAPNPVYDSYGSSYALFANLFFGLLFLLCLLIGWYRNGRTLKGYEKLLQSTSLKADFLGSFGGPLTWINFGFYGLMILAYFDLVIFLTKGAGFTGATFGVILAALTFSATGQPPKNVWPILAGFMVLSGLVQLFCLGAGAPVPWTLSTQGYLNAAAFATGLCPFTGVYNRKIGILAGMICATLCTSTSVMHGGFMLYNGGLTAGITALILTPMLEHYYRK